MGRFHTVDRFAEKYSFQSPYVYAGNNPILNIDVNGDSLTNNAWEWMNKLLKHQQNKVSSIKSKISDTKSDLLNGDLSEKKRSRKLKHYNKLQNKLSKANKILYQLQNEFIVLDESDQIYDVQMSSDLGSSVLGKVTFDKKTDIFTIHLLKGQGNLGQVAHEFKHAYQFETGDFAFAPSGKAGAKNYLWDVYNERDANNWSQYFGSKTTTAETGPEARQFIRNEQDARKIVNKRIGIIFRYNGTTYK